MSTTRPDRTPYPEHFATKHIRNRYPSAFSPNPDEYNAWDDVLALRTFIRLNRGNATAGNHLRPSCPAPVLEKTFLDFQLFAKWFYDHIDQEQHDELLNQPSHILFVKRGFKSPDLGMIHPDTAVLCRSHPGDASNVLDQTTARLYRANTPRTIRSATRYLLNLIETAGVMVCEEDKAAAVRHLTRQHDEADAKIIAASDKTPTPRPHEQSEPVQLTLDI